MPVGRETRASGRKRNEIRIFLDTANIDQIKQAAKLGIISGVTTNPSLVSREATSVLARNNFFKEERRQVDEVPSSSRRETQRG